MRPSDLIQGTLDVLILKSLATRIAPRLGHRQAHPGGVGRCAADQAGLTLPRAASPREPGTDRAEWKKNETGREAKFYTLTRAGRAQLQAEVSQWERLSAAIQLTLKHA